MALKLIVFLINAVIANDLAPANGIEIPTLLSASSSHENQHKEVTLNQIPNNNYEDVIELQKEEPSPCQSVAVLIPMLNQLINLLTQDPSNVNKVSRISTLLQEYIKNMADNAQSNESFKLINQDAGDKNTLRTGYYGAAKGHVKTKIVFKYDLPSINQPQCKDVFMRLIKTAYDAYVQLAKNSMCQNADIIETLLKKAYEIPYNVDSGVNLSPSKIPGTKEEYSIYDLLKPQLDQINGYQEPNNVNGINNYGNYKPMHPNVNSNAGYLEPKTNILSNLMDDKLKPNVYELNPYGNGKNPNILTPNGQNLYEPEIQPTDNLKYDDNLNIYNIYDNVNKKELTPQTDSNNLFPENFNLSPKNLKVPDNYWKPSVNINGQNPNAESIMSILATTKPPEDNPQLKYQMYPNTINGVPNQNMNYPYKDQKLIYQYESPGIVTNLDTTYQKVPQYPSNQFGVPSMDANSYQQNLYNNYLNKLTVLPNLQQSDGVTNAFKLDPSSESVIELTFVLKHTTPLVYQPLHFVKFRIPYSTFLYNVNNLLLAKPHLKINPLKLYQELITLSDVSDISPGLRGYKKEDILRLAYHNGKLVTAKLVKDDSSLNEQLKLVQSLNSGIGAADILKLTSKNNILKAIVPGGNSSYIRTGITQYGQPSASYYDLGSAGVGFNSEPTHYDKEGLKITKYGVRPLTFASFGSNVVRPQHLSLGNKKSAYGTFSVGLQG